MSQDPSSEGEVRSVSILTQILRDAIKVLLPAKQLDLDGNDDGEGDMYNKSSGLAVDDDDAAAEQAALDAQLLGDVAGGTDLRHGFTDNDGDQKHRPSSVMDVDQLDAQQGSNDTDCPRHIDDELLVTSLNELDFHRGYLTGNQEDRKQRPLSGDLTWNHQDCKQVQPVVVRLPPVVPEVNEDSSVGVKGQEDPVLRSNGPQKRQREVSPDFNSADGAMKAVRTAISVTASQTAQRPGQPATSRTWKRPVASAYHGRVGSSQSEMDIDGKQPPLARTIAGLPASSPPKENVAGISRGGSSLTKLIRASSTIAIPPEGASAYKHLKDRLTNGDCFKGKPRVRVAVSLSDQRGAIIGNPFAPINGMAINICLAGDYNEPSISLQVKINKSHKNVPLSQDPNIAYLTWESCGKPDGRRNIIDLDFMTTYSSLNDNVLPLALKDLCPTVKISQLRMLAVIIFESGSCETSNLESGWLVGLPEETAKGLMALFQNRCKRTITLWFLHPVDNDRFFHLINHQLKPLKRAVEKNRKPFDRYTAERPILERFPEDGARTTGITKNQESAIVVGAKSPSHRSNPVPYPGEAASQVKGLPNPRLEALEMRTPVGHRMNTELNQHQRELQAKDQEIRKIRLDLGSQVKQRELLIHNLRDISARGLGAKDQQIYNLQRNLRGQIMQSDSIARNLRRENGDLRHELEVLSLRLENAERRAHRR